MKLGCKGVWIDIPMDNIFNKFKQILYNASDAWDAKKVKDYTVALIDDRYYENGYIIDYGKVHCSVEDITAVDFISHLTLIDAWCGLTLEKIFIGEAKEYLVESTGELNGYEDDTPNLSGFDFIIKL